MKAKDANTHLGHRLDFKDHGDIALFTTEGKTAHLDGKDIAAFGAPYQSLILDGLEAGVSAGDFQDPLAFLESLK